MLIIHEHWNDIIHDWTILFVHWQHWVPKHKVYQSSIFFGAPLTSVYESPDPSSNGGIWHWPQPLLPQATTRPSLRKSSVWSPPAETCCWSTLQIFEWDIRGDHDISESFRLSGQGTKKPQETSTNQPGCIKLLPPKLESDTGHDHHTQNYSMPEPCQTCGGQAYDAHLQTPVCMKWYFWNTHLRS